MESSAALSQMRSIPLLPCFAAVKPSALATSFHQRNLSPIGGCCLTSHQRNLSPTGGCCLTSHQRKLSPTGDCCLFSHQRGLLGSLHHQPCFYDPIKETKAVIKFQNVKTKTLCATATSAATTEVEEPPAAAEPQPQTLLSSHLGANLDTHGGCTFSVWAPHAQEAEVALIQDGHEPDAKDPDPDAKDPEPHAKDPEPVLVPMTRQGNIWSVHVPDVKPGCKYWFIFTVGGQRHWRRDARARATDYDSEICYVVDPRFSWVPFTPPAFHEINIYQLHVGAFTGRLEDGGTFGALEQKLQYIADLGFTAIEMLPVHEYCGSWGYNPRLLFSIHPNYGTPEDLRRLVEAAHKKGLAVIFDVVLNHGATKLNSLWAYDGRDEGNRGGIYFDGGSDTDWGRTFAWWQKDVKDMVVDAARMFLTEYNGDGLRFDCVQAMPWDLLQKITYTMRQEHPNKILISEITPERPEVITGAGFDATWMHSSYYDMRAFVKERRSLRKLQSLLTLHPGYSKTTQCVKYFLGCHDQIGCRKNGGFDPEIQGHHRYAVELYGGRGNWDARAMARMWYACQVVAQGIPMMFMGSEWNHDGWWGVDKHHCLNWDKAGDEIGQQMLSLVTDANKLRRSSEALQKGSLDTTHFDESNCIIGFSRKSGSQSLVVVVNASGAQWNNGDYGVRVGGQFGDGTEMSEVFNSQEKGYGGWEGSGNQGKTVIIRNGKAFINLPNWSVLCFVPA